MEEEHKSTAPSISKTAKLSDGTNVTSKGIKNWRKLAEKPGNKAKQIVASTNLVQCYRHGFCVDKDEKEANKFERKAAMLGDAMSQYNLSIKYVHGIGVDKNLDIASMWCGKAAAQGFAMAQLNFGTYFDEGKGVEQNSETAVHWYSKAAAQGHASAQSNLGACFGKGTGVQKNLETAVHWYSKAAAQGLAMAQFNLGLCFERGQGVAEDLEEAKRFFQLAADQGHAPAIAKLAAMLREGPNADLHESNKLLRKAKKAIAAGTDVADKEVAQKVVNHFMSNLKCSNEGCTSVLNIDMSEDVKKKRLSKMKACAQCQRTQYCSKECTFPLFSLQCLIFSLFKPFPFL